MKKFLFFLALALCFVACQNEAEVNVGNDGIAAVTLNVGVPELATRADQDANKGHDSAFGAIDYFTATEWAKYDLRYILEVYAADDNGSGDPIYKERLEKIVNEYAPVTFDLRLIPNRTYKFVVWADFLTEGSQLDWHYNTTDLNAITLNDFGVMDETYDAYFVSENVEITATGSKSLTLRRPFGKVRVISTDKQYIENYATPTTAKVTYTSTLYKSFNAVNGNIATERQGNELESEYTITGVYELGKDAEADKMTVFAGYFFARDTEDEFNFTLEVFDQYNNPIKSYDFNTQIPVKRNHLTTIEGNILTIQSDITISIDDNFGGETVVDPEIAGIASPEVTATVDGNKVTLAWAAVEGATSYYTRIKGEGNVFEKTTELTKVYENLAWETTYAFEVYAANDNGNTSFTTVVENVAIGEEPVVLTYNIYLKNEDNWDAVYFYAWGDDFKTEDWPGEQMTKTTVEEVEYYVYALPAEATGKTINFLFNNGGNGKQTADIEGVVVDKNYFYTNYVEPAQPVETPEYMVQIPAGDYDSVIFVRMNPASSVNDWGNKWNQTGDLKVADGNWFALPSDSWDGATTTWSNFELAEDGYLYFNANDNWKQANARFAAYFFGNAGNTWVDVVEYVPAETPETPETPEEPEQPEQPTENTLTVAEFLALTDVVPSNATAEEIAAAPRYTLTGTITSVTNSTYGNFYLNDGTSEVLIYGLVGPNGESQYWATSGAKVGDDITVKTIRTEYNNAPQGKNATFVEVKTPGTLAFWSFDATAATFTAAGGEKTIKVDIYNATSAVNVTSDNDQFSAVYANGVLTISALENTEFEAIDGKVTITCGTLSQVIGVSQAAASSTGGEQTEVTTELKFIAANRTSFDTSKQTWEVEGVKLVNDKGSSTSNVADYVNPARFYKSSKITVSADGNITTIVFDCNSASYATALKDSIKTGTVSVSSDKVTVTLDGSSNEYVISSLTGGQVRMDSMTVTYLQ